MHDSERVKSLNTQTHLCEYLEDDFLLKHLVLIAHVSNSMCQITAIRIFHHQAIDILYRYGIVKGNKGMKKS